MTTEGELAAIRSSDPDPAGLEDVVELIAPGAHVHGSHPLAGGAGTAMHVVGLTMPSEATTAFVLRRYLSEVGDDAAAATAEARTLEALRSTPVAAPEVLWLDARGRVFGRPAMAMTRVPGHLRTTEAGHPAVVRGLAAALVSLRWVPLDAVDHLPVVSAPATTLPDEPNSDVVDARAVVDALRRHAPTLQAEPAGLCHGDFHVGNVLFEGDRPSGIVDWPHAHVGDPRADLAYCALDLALVAGPDVARGFLDEYAALRGDVPDEAWWRLWAVTRALPDPRSWLPPWQALGVPLTVDRVIDRFVAWTERALADLAD